MRQRLKNLKYTWENLTELTEARGLAQTAAAIGKYSPLLGQQISGYKSPNINL